MRVTNALTGRPQYYDRNPLSIVILGFNSLGVAPHASTFRGQYTVPTNRKAQMTSLSLLLSRATVAGTPAKANMTAFRSTDNGSYEATIYTNVVGDRDRLAEGAGTIFLAGEVISLKTSDVSVTGTIDYNGDVWLYEFDA